MWGSTCRHVGNKTGTQYCYQRAVAWYSYATNKNPAFRQARLDRGILLWREMERCQEAVEEFDILLEDDPKDAPAWLNRALANQKLGDFPNALQDIETYLRLPVQDEGYWHHASQMMKTLQMVLDEQVGTS